MKTIEAEEAAAVGARHGRLELASSYSAFIPGAFIHDTGPDQRVHYSGVEVSFLF